MISNPKVVITDYDYGDFEIEKAILHGVGAEVIPLQAKCEEELFEAAEDCFGMHDQSICSGWPGDHSTNETM